MSRQTVMVFAGPNGAGKTTAAKTILGAFEPIVEFVNADEIARGLSPLNPEGVALEAGRIMLKRMGDLLGRGESFAFETTLSGKGHAVFLRRAQADGYQVVLHYFFLPSPQLSLERVAARVRMGGHNIPEVDIRRRFGKALRNLLKIYIPLSDEARVYDARKPPSLMTKYPIFRHLRGKEPVIISPDIWRELEAMAHEQDR